MLTVYSWNTQVEFMNLETVSKAHAVENLKKEDLTKFTEISFNQSVKRVESGVIELFPNINKLIFHHHIECIEESTELESLLKKNSVIIRGYYDTCAEELAKKLHLKFIHADITLGSHDNEEYCECSTYKLCFEDDGTPYLHYNQSVYGYSAAGSLGGERRTNLNKDFYIGQTTDDIANWFGEHFSNQVRENDYLKAYLEKANERLNKTDVM